MFAAAAVASAHAAHNRRQREQALHAMHPMAPALPLWRTAEELMQPVWLLFVFVHDISLVPKLANQRVQLRVRYGSDGCYKEKYSHKVRSTTPVGSEQASATFESLFVFPWSRTLQPSVMIDLVKLGFIDWTISTASMRIHQFGEGNPGAIDHDVLFFGKKGEDGFIGQTNVFIEVRSISRAELELGIDRFSLSALDMAFAEQLGGLESLAVLHPSPLGVLRLPTPGLREGGHGMHPHAGSPAIGGTPVVLGHAMPRGASTMGLGVVQGSAVDSSILAPSYVQGERVVADAASARSTSVRPSRQDQGGTMYEEAFLLRNGQVRHVMIHHHPDGTEEELEYAGDL